MLKFLDVLKRYSLVFSLFIVIALFAMTMASCSSNSHIFSKTEYEHTDYGILTTYTVKRGSIELHIEEKLYSSQEQAEFMLDQIEKDYQTLEDIFHLKTKITVYVIADAYILGKEHGVYINDRVYCNAGIIVSGEYRQFLTAAYIDVTDPWKEYGAYRYAFHKSVEEDELLSYYGDENNLLNLTLFAAYFKSEFAEAQTIDIAQRTAASLSRFIIEKYGLNSFKKAELTEYRQEWLDSKGIKQNFAVPFELSWLDGAVYSSSVSYPLIIETKNRLYNLDSVSSVRESASMDTAERVLYQLSEGYSGILSVLEHVKLYAPKMYKKVSARFNEKITYNISEDVDATGADPTKNKVDLYNPGEYVHETAHMISLPKSFGGIGWLAEGLAVYFDNEVSEKIGDMNDRYYESFMGESLKKLYPDFSAFTEELLENYTSRGGSMASVKDMDFALLERSIAHLTLTKPEWKGKIRKDVPILAMSVSEKSAWYSSSMEGNDLTYFESYLFVKYLMGRFGLDDVLSLSFADNYNFEKAFGSAYSTIFTEFLSEVQDGKIDWDVPLPTPEISVFSVVLLIVIGVVVLIATCTAILLYQRKYIAKKR